MIHSFELEGIKIVISSSFLAACSLAFLLASFKRLRRSASRSLPDSSQDLSGDPLGVDFLDLGFEGLKV